MTLNIEIFDKKPEGFTPHVEVAGCYIEIENKLLLLEYAGANTESGKWGVPAGKIEKDETPLNAARRELFEETAISLGCQSQIHYVNSMYIRKPDVDYIFHLFKVQLDQIPDVNLSHEHQSYRWATSQDIEEMPLVDGGKEALFCYKTTPIKRMPHAHVNSYLVLKKNDKVLLGLRKNTGYCDGMWCLVAGHVEGGESATTAMIREAKEEIGILPSQLKVVHVMHRQTNRLNIDVFFECEAWEGSLENLEPEKCEKLEFFAWDALPPNLVDYNASAIKAILNKEFYSEEGWKS